MKPSRTLFFLSLATKVGWVGGVGGRLRGETPGGACGIYRGHHVLHLLRLLSPLPSGGHPHLLYGHHAACLLGLLCLRCLLRLLWCRLFSEQLLERIFDASFQFFVAIITKNYTKAP